MDNVLKYDGMKRTTKVVCIGDSLTEGYGISEDPLGPYPAQLQRKLGPDFEVYNQGVSCTCSINRTLNGRIVGMPYVRQEQWEEALAIPGDIYVVIQGTNDAQNGYNEEEDRPDEYNDVYAFREYFREDYRKLVNEIRRRRPEAAIFSVKPSPVTGRCIWRKHQQAYLEDILERLDGIWKEEPWLYTIDLHSVFLSVPEERRYELYQADGLHPSRKGAGLMAETIGNAILEYMESDLKKDAKRYGKLGYHTKFFEFRGRKGVMVCPVKAKPGNPWIWRTEFLGAFDFADIALLEKGWHLVYVRMSDWYGAPEIIDFMEEFHAYAVHTLSLNPKADLFGFSRGGLYAVNFAAKNPEKVRTIYLDAPVIDLASWPGGFYGNSAHLPKEWREACEVYRMSEAELKKYKEGLPKKFKALYESRIPILLVAGMEDQDVPYEENGALLENFMLQRNSQCFKAVKKPNCAHHPHSLENPEEIVEFYKCCENSD